MMTDLIAELRADAEAWQGTIYSDLVTRAAVEIERLTAELETRTNSLRSIIESYVSLVAERDRLAAELAAAREQTVRFTKDDAAHMADLQAERDRLRAALRELLHNPCAASEERAMNLLPPLVACVKHDGIYEKPCPHCEALAGGEK